MAPSPQASSTPMPMLEMERTPRQDHSAFCSKYQSHGPAQKLLLGPGDFLCHLLPRAQVRAFLAGGAQA